MFNFSLKKQFIMSCFFHRFIDYIDKAKKLSQCLLTLTQTMNPFQYGMNPLNFQTIQLD